jgi:hypothetical protein
LKTYETPHYLVRTDLDPDDAREACLRLTKLADEYGARLKGISPAADQKMAAYLYRRAADYEAAGGRPDAGGHADARALLAVAGDRADARTWNVVQHEAFHLWVRIATDRALPPWLEEGTAEYFGEGIWCGDEFLTGALPPWRVARLKERVRAKKLRPLAQLVRLTRDKWGARGLSQAEYDQAWSLVHFLTHAAGGKYREGLSTYLTRTARGESGDKAWAGNLPRVDLLETEWRDWVTQLPADPTPDVYARAACSTLTSFLARATGQGQSFASWPEFQSAAEAAQLRSDPDDWLPPSLLRQGLALAKQQGTWTLIPPTADAPTPKLVVTLPDGTKISGQFRLEESRVRRVQTED